MNRFGFLILSLSILTGHLSAQTSKIDSLRHVLKKDTANFDALRQLAGLLADINVTESVMYAKRAKVIAMGEGDTSHIVTSSRLLGQLYNRQTNVNMAI